MAPKNHRYLVRRNTKEVFIYTDLLRKHHPELEEVIAETPAAALDKKGMPDPRRISVLDLEVMPKKDLIAFAHLQLKMELDPQKKKSDLVDEVKVAIFSLPSGAGGDDVDEVVVDMTNAKGGQAVNATTPLRTPRSKSPGA